MGSKKGAPRGEYSIYNRRPKQVSCDVCKQKYKRKEILLHHIFAKHLNYCVYCPLCDKKYISVSVCNRHLKTVHNVLNRGVYSLQFEPKKQPNVNKFDNEFSRNISSISCAESKEMGIHIISNINFEVGQEIYAAAPFASIEYFSSVRNSCCFHCGAANIANSIQCPHCIELWFCSERCRKTKTHLSKCNTVFVSTDCELVRITIEIIKKAAQMFPNITSFLHYIRGIRNTSKNNNTPYTQYEQILNLKGKGHEKYVDMANRVLKHLLYLPKFEAIKESNQVRLLYFLAYRHIITLQINAFSDVIPVANGVLKRLSLYNKLSRFNHSCCPKTYNYVDDDNVIYVIATRRITRGEQIFISYLSDTKFDSPSARTNYIEKSWNFICTCDKCTGNDREVSKMREKSAEFEYIKKNFIHDVQTRQNTIVQFKKSCESYLNKFQKYLSIDDIVISCYIMTIHENNSN